MKLLDKKAFEKWNTFRMNLKKSTFVPVESIKEKTDRINKLEADPEAWFKYYFPNYYSSEPALFHKKATKRLFSNDNWYEGRAWSRELAKSTRAMMETLFMTMIGKRKNVLLVSHTYDNACDLLMPFMINLEENSRLINDYGFQKNIGQWEIGKFVTINGVSFRAIGSGQSPRGTRNEEARPDMIIIDDIDTDEKSRNPERVKATWEWIERALMPTVSISGKWTFLFLGNIIAQDCIMLRVKEMADHFEVINIRDKNGQSTWKEKNTEAMIDRILSKISYLSAQQEYYNNPIKEGTVFKDIVWGKIPSLKQFAFLIAYGDPAPSNKENKSNCYKVVVLVGKFQDKYYVINARLDQVINAKYVDWYYELNEYAAEKTVVYNYIENNSLQDPFYEQVFKPLFREANKVHPKSLYPTPDERKKPDKFARIEGNLEPLNRNGKLIFNEAEKENPHMKRLAEQFKAVEPTLSAHVDGPDAVEGAKYIIESKTLTMHPITLGARRSGSYVNKKRF